MTEQTPLDRIEARRRMDALRSQRVRGVRRYVVLLLVLYLATIVGAAFGLASLFGHKP
jgi:uncharacterized membrane protein (DUF485 family)